MTESQARTIANIMMVAAAGAAAFVILRSPKLRRLAWQASRHYVRGPLAVWGAELVREAWLDSGRARTV